MNHKKIQGFFTTRKDGDMNIPQKREKVSGGKEVVLMKQMHGSNILVVGDGYTKQEGDGLITQRKDVALFVRVADCLPILFFDPVREVIAVAHAGRQGTFQNISGKMIQTFVTLFQSKPEDILVEIGPGINVCCYEVCAKDNEHCLYVSEHFGEAYVHGKNIDIPGINKQQLVQAGVLSEHIFHKNVCTFCQGENYFSYRKGDLKERFAGVISFS